MRDETAAPTRSRRAISCIGLACATALALARVFDDRGSADAAFVAPLMHEARGASTTTVGVGAARGPAADAEKTRRLSLALSRELDASAPRVAFEPLAESARLAWAGVQAQIVTSAPTAAVTTTPDTPPFPFQWVGLWDEPAAADASSRPPPKAIITGDRTTWMAAQGDVLDDDWRIDKISRSQLKVTYLPSSTPQTISMNKP